MRHYAWPCPAVLLLALLCALLWPAPGEAARRQAPQAHKRQQQPAYGVRLVKPRSKARAAKRPRHRKAMPSYAPPSAALLASAALVLDPASEQVLLEKNAHALMPIASITKLMTATVVLEAGQDLAEMLTVTSADVDRVKHSSSRLRVGSRLSRAEMLHIALMSSENRAASALCRHYPGGMAACVAAMNAKARSLGMARTRYVDATGLSSANVSTPSELAKLVIAAAGLPLIRDYSTSRSHAVMQGVRPTRYRNSNRLIASGRWRIALQKTGYISEAGRCVVMHTVVAGRAVVMVLLGGQGKYSRATDANRIRAWLELTRAGRAWH